MSEQSAPATAPSITPSMLVARGFALFPLRAGTKLPAVARDWERVATTSLLRLRQLTADPHANYGVACGPSNLVVIDLDVAKQAAPGETTYDAPTLGEPTHGLQVLRELAAGYELPRTFTVGTPSGGRHLYFRPPVDGPAPRNTVRRLGPLIDTRGVGGYVVAPGSRVDGVDYRILEDAPIAELPEWISTLLRPIESRPAAGEPLPLATALGPVGARLGGAYARSALEREAARVETARVGTRNDTLNRAAYSLGTLVGSGVLDQAQVEVELTRAALAAGLDARETAGTVRSGLTAGIARPRRLVGVGASAAAAGFGTGVSPGQLSLVDGDGGGGDDERDGSRGGNANGRAAGTRTANRDADDNGLATHSRPLIPTLVPQPADWPRIFGRFDGLGAAAAALRQELAASMPGFTLPPEPAASSSAPSASAPPASTTSASTTSASAPSASAFSGSAASSSPSASAPPESAASASSAPAPPESAASASARSASSLSAPARSASASPDAADPESHLVTLLDEFDAAYDLTARAGGALAGSARWLGIQALADLLRDLRDELAARAAGTESISAQALAVLRGLTRAAARRIVTLAREITAKLGADGLRRSPLGSALRRTQQAAEALAGDATAPTPLTPARFATGRGALQAQLAAMRRDLRTATDRATAMNPDRASTDPSPADRSAA